MNHTPHTVNLFPSRKTSNVLCVTKRFVLMSFTILLLSSVLCRTATANNSEGEINFSDGEIKFIEDIVEFCNEYQKELARLIVRFKDKGATREQAMDGHEGEQPHNHIVSEAYNYDVSMKDFAIFYEKIQRDCYANVIRELESGKWNK